METGKRRNLTGLWLTVALCVLLMGFSALPAEASVVASGNCGASGSNVTWSLDSAGTLTISGSGDMNNWSSFSNVPWQDNRRLMTTCWITSKRCSSPLMWVWIRR